MSKYVSCNLCYEGLNIDDKKPTWCDSCWDQEVQRLKYIEDEILFLAGHKKPKETNECRWLWYSVRPGAGDNIKNERAFKKRIDKFLNVKAVEDFIYCFEWKWANGEVIPHSLHCHMLIKPVAKKVKYLNQHIDRQREKYFNLNKNQRYYIYKDNENVARDKLDYMMGKTWDSDKNTEKCLDKARMEKIFSTSHFTKSNCDPCDFGDIVKSISPKSVNSS